MTIVYLVAWRDVYISNPHAGTFASSETCGHRFTSREAAVACAQDLERKGYTEVSIRSMRMTDAVRRV